MSKKKIALLITTAYLFASFLNIKIQAQTSSVFVSGLRAPEKIIYAQKQGYFLVSEVGDPQAPNSGRVSIVTKDGERFTLIDGLPSGPAPPSNDPSGPSALFIQGDKLYIAIGSGNETLAGPAPGSEIPNPNPNSPIFSSILELRISSFKFFARRGGYSLSLADHILLANGHTVVLGRYSYPHATLRLVANFPDYTPSFRPDVPNNVRNSNPFGLALSANTLYVADAAQNNIQAVDLEDGSIRTLITYPPRQNPTPIGPPFIDSVPDSLRLFGNRLLVTFLTGFPFPAAAADVRQYDFDSGEESMLIGGLSSAIDVLPVNKGGFCHSVYTLEFSANMLMNAPGRLQRFDSPDGTPTVISNSLISPTSMARNPANGDLLITEIFTGRIIRISNP